MKAKASERWNSRQVWLRQRLSKFSGFFPKQIMDVFIQVPWRIKPFEISTYFSAENPTLVPFALSKSGVGQRTLTTFRIIDRSNLTPALTVWIYQDGSTFKSGLIPLAEDARVFQFEDSLFIYYQIAVQKSDGSLDCDIYVFDPERSRTNQLISPLSFNGKNWIPYQYQGDLFFIYSVDPLIVFRAAEWTDDELVLDLVFPKHYKTPEPFTWGDDLELFSSVRGGSQLIPLGNHELLAFTHVTSKGILKFSHQAGVLLFNAKDFTFKHIFLTRLKPGLLIDPFGIQIENNVVQMSYSISINNPHENASVVGSSIATFKLSELLQEFGVSE